MSTGSHAHGNGLRILVTGLVAQYPLGGVAWDYLQYVLGLIRLGHDVYYIEDTGQWPYDPVQGGTAKRPDATVAHLRALMDRFGLEDRWAYRFPWRDQWFGLSDAQRRNVIDSADLVVNVSGTLSRPDRYRKQGRLVYIDSDPVFTQVKIARGQADFRELVEKHDKHFTFGERLGRDARVPDTGHRWQPTRQPVVLSEWQGLSESRCAFTTVMNWNSFNEVQFEGRTYGQKDTEFPPYLDLPQRVRPIELEIAMAEGKNRQAPVDLLRHKGWRIVNPDRVCPDVDSYRAYLASSRGEWSIAKGGYVIGQSGWFSCRSACYLALGRPVVVQDTGFSHVLPTGNGLFGFRSITEAVAALREVEGRYEHHSRAAKALAEEYFDSDKVLSKLVDDAMSTTFTEHATVEDSPA